jgi:hypothetical protein
MTINQNDSAFPWVEVATRSDGTDYEAAHHSGMDLRDYFAAHALAGYIASCSGPGMSRPDAKEAATEAYGYADAMLKARAEAR